MTDNKSQVVGLYSFPKSGNTWLRAIIAAAADIPQGPGMLQKYVTDTHYGPVRENPWPFQGTDWYFYKSHHKHPLKEDQSGPLHTDKFVYIYRHPLAVLMSYINFVSNKVSPAAGKSLGMSFDSVDDLSKEDLQKLFNIYLRHGTILPKNKVFGSIFENIGNFRSMAARGEPVHVVRYEDLQDNFGETVAGICSFIGFEGVTPDSVYEGAEGRTKQNGKFFWKRKKDNYSEYLNTRQIERFYTMYEDEMNELGYRIEDEPALSGTAASA